MHIIDNMHINYNNCEDTTVHTSENHFDEHIKIFDGDSSVLGFVSTTGLIRVSSRILSGYGQISEKR